MPHLKNRITKPRIIATMLQPFSPPQFSKWTAYLKSRKKSDFFWKIFFPCNFVKKFPKDLGWCAIRSRHIGPTIGLSLSWFWARNAKNLTFWGNSSERSRSMVGPIWRERIAHQPRSFGYFLTKLHGKKIFKKILIFSWFESWEKLFEIL